MNYQSFYDEVRTSNTLSKELISTLLETLEYNNYSFINWSIETLSIIKVRLDRGDRIMDEVSGEVYTPESFHTFVAEHFLPIVEKEVFAKKSKKENKYYFQLQKCENGYQMVLAPDSKQKTYEWISSLSERFSLVYMVATGVVYIKNIKTSSYAPFISENGKYCRYDKSEGKLIEIG